MMKLMIKNKKSSFTYIRQSSLSSLIVSPLIYSTVIPYFLLDIWMWFYQNICFRAYGIEKVERSKYLVFDRGHLKYLSQIEKINCNFCAYTNGLISYSREIASRTEQYFCPIKHKSNSFLGHHDKYKNFYEFGDADGYKKKP